MMSGQGANVIISVVNKYNLSATSSAFSYSQPYLMSIHPTEGPTVGGIPVTLTGENFGFSGGVSFGGRFVPIRAYGHKEITLDLPQGEGVAAVLVRAGQIDSNSLNFTYLGPEISDLIPRSGMTQGGSVLTIVGNNFGRSGGVTVGAVECKIANYTHTVINCFVPEGQGTHRPVIVTSSGGVQAESPVFFAYAPPLIVLTTPHGVPYNVGGKVIIEGINFGLHGNVYVTETKTNTTQMCVATAYGHNRIECTVLPVDSEGAATITVVVADQVSNRGDFAFTKNEETALSSVESFKLTGLYVLLVSLLLSITIVI